MVPRVGAMRPAIALMSVVFPQPDGPTTTTNSPSATVRLTSWRATSRCRRSARTYSTLRWSISIRAIPLPHFECCASAVTANGTGDPPISYPVYDSAGNGRLGAREAVMRFTVRLQNSSCMATVENLLRVAGEAEELGYYGVSVQDHLISNSAVSTCGIHGTHAGDDRVVFEPLQVLACLAGQTRRVRLVTAVLVLPTRNAILMAKQLATLDVLSNGRLIVGVGVGATPGE